MKQGQRGAAVIVAILIVTLAASTAAFAIWQQSLWVRQLENITDRARADQLATSAIDVARDTLRQDKERGVDHPGEAWANTVTLPAENAVVDGVITDQQGLFNVNNLASGPLDGPYVKAFAKLLDNLNQNQNRKPSMELAVAVAQYTRPDPSGLVDLYYLSLDPPYRAAQRELTDIAELSRIKGFDADLVRSLAPYLTALPATTAATLVNVNTTKPEVLAALLPNLTLSAAKVLLEKQKEPFKGPQEFKAQLPPTVVCGTGAGNCYDVKSSYFTATVRVKSGRVEAGYTALLRRDPSPTAWPVILWRKDAAD